MSKSHEDRDQITSRPVRTFSDIRRKRDRDSLIGLATVAVALGGISLYLGISKSYEALAGKPHTEQTGRPPLGSCALEYTVLKGEPAKGERPVKIDVLSQAPKGTGFTLFDGAQNGALMDVGGTTSNNGIPPYTVDLTPGTWSIYATIDVPEASKGVNVIETCNTTFTVARLPGVSVSLPGSTS